jgi:hypothetical protein
MEVPSAGAAEPAIKIKQEPAAAPPSTAAADPGEPSEQLRLFTLDELAGFADACARAPRATDDCSHQCMLLLQLLRGGDPAVVVANAARTPLDCEWRWDVSFPEEHDIKVEPSVLGGAYLEWDRGVAPVLNSRDPATVRLVVDLSSEVEEALSCRPAPAANGMPRHGQVAFRSAPADALCEQLAAYARTSPLAGPADVGVVTLLHEVEEGQLEGAGVHGHMVVYYYSKDTGVVFLDSSRGPGQRLPSWAELLGVVGCRTDCVQYCGVWLHPAGCPGFIQAAAAPPLGTVVQDLVGEAAGESGRKVQLGRGAKRRAELGPAAESTSDSHEEWRAVPRRRKVTRRAGQAAAGGRGVEEVAAGPADPPRGQRHGTEWEAQLARLVAYKVAHGDCNVLNRWAEDRRLATWVSSQRKRKRKLDRGEPSEGMTTERAARLTALGFVWDPGRTGGTPREEEWEAQLARLAAYKAARGDCNVLNRWAEDRRLGTWVGTQRKGKRRLDRGEPSEGMTTERAARLTALGFVWSPDEAIWEAQFARLAAYKAARGDCNVPQGWAEDPRLGTWVKTQRRGKRKLDRGEPREGMTAARAARLTALGLVWEPRAN